MLYFWSFSQTALFLFKFKSLPSSFLLFHDLTCITIEYSKKKRTQTYDTYRKMKILRKSVCYSLFQLLHTRQIFSPCSCSSCSVQISHVTTSLQARVETLAFPWQAVKWFIWGKYNKNNFSNAPNARSTCKIKTRPPTWLNLNWQERTKIHLSTKTIRIRV